MPKEESLTTEGREWLTLWLQPLAWAHPTTTLVSKAQCSTPAKHIQPPCSSETENSPCRVRGSREIPQVGNHLVMMMGWTGLATVSGLWVCCNSNTTGFPCGVILAEESPSRAISKILALLIKININYSLIIILLVVRMKK